MLSGPSQGGPVVCGNYNNVSFNVGEEMPRREKIVKVSFDVGEGRLRREQEMDAIRMRSLELLYRLWYGKDLESSHTLSLDTMLASHTLSLETMQLGDFASTLAELSDEIWSEDDNLQLHATILIEKLLSIERECPKTLVKNGVVRRLVHFLMRDDFSCLQVEAARVLIKIFCGACGNTKAESVREAVPCFVRLLDSPSDDVCEQAVFALGIVADDSRNFRDLVLRNGVLVPLLKQLEKHANLGKHAKLSMMRNLTWTLSIFCEDISESSYKKAKPALTTLERLLHNDDVEVLINSCWAIHGLSFGVHGKIDPLMDAGLCPKLVEHLLHTSRWVQIPVLMTLSLITFKSTHIQALIKNGALPRLLALLTEDRKDKDPKGGDRKIKKEVCKVIYGILHGNECQIQAVIDAKLFGHLMNLLESPDEGLQEEAAQIISKATSRGSRKQIEYLVYECKIINPICNFLSSPNPINVKLGLQVLGNVLEAGTTSKQDLGSSSSDVCPPPNNPYIQLIVETGCVERIEKILTGECLLHYDTVELAGSVIDLAGDVMHLLGLNDDIFMIPSDIDDVYFQSHACDL